MLRFDEVTLRYPRPAGAGADAAAALDDATLDRIDEIVPPGTNLYHPDGVWRPPALTDAALRRRRR